MNNDQRKNYRIQVSEGRDHASLQVGGQQMDGRILDESSGGFAVALRGDVDVQQNQVLVLKTATGHYETRVARVEYFDDGKLLGLMRLRDFSDAAEKELRVSSWRDYFFLPQQSTGAAGGWTTGIAATVVVGVFLSILAACFFFRFSPDRRTPATDPQLQQYTEAAFAEIENARAAALKAEQLAREKERSSSKGRRSSQFLRQQAKVSSEVLYRLRLDSDQSRRIREILSRTSGDLTSAEAEIRSVLTAEQAQQWQSLAP